MKLQVATVANSRSGGELLNKGLYFYEQGKIKMKLFSSSVLMFEVAVTQCLVLPQHKQ